MGDEDDVAGIFLEEVLQPANALGVQVVGRLVEQQDVRLFEQQSNQRHAALLTTRQVRDRAVGRRAAHRLHRLLQLRIEAPAVGGVDLRLKLAHLLHQLVEVGVVLRIAHFGRDRVKPIDHRRDRACAQAHVLDHRLVGIELWLLRQIADLDPLGGPRLAGELGIDPAHDLHERGLARSVRPDDRDLRAGDELQADVVEHRLVGAREGLGQTLHDVGILDGHGSPVAP